MTDLKQVLTRRQQMSDSSKQDKKNQGAIKEAKETEPTRALSPFEEMDRMVENFFSRGWMPPLHWPHSLLGEWEAPLERKVLPRVDVINRDHELVLHAQVPGVKKEDLDVSVTENTVTIKGTTSHEKKEEKGDYYRRECSHGSFSRTIALPDNADTANVKAAFNNGMLELIIPKTEKTERRNITID